ncbi:hypothetical protein [Paenibacillus sp. FSL R7-0128]|uniref:hypothetical protein n=1 Tax=Paenibacillus sp. FSL R7-0128 TaxID=2954529 RepID=UPI0030FBF923
MTPETLKSTCAMFRKELEVQGASLGIMSVFDSMCSYLGGESRDLNRALAALEETEGDIITLKQKVELYEEALETYKDNRAAMKEQLAEAQQTIARQREALEFYARDYNHEFLIVEGDKGAIARAALGGETQP